MPFSVNVPRLYLLNHYPFNWLIHCSISHVVSDIWKKNFFYKDQYEKCMDVCMDWCAWIRRL